MQKPMQQPKLYDYLHTAQSRITFLCYMFKHWGDSHVVTLTCVTDRKLSGEIKKIKTRPGPPGPSGMPGKPGMNGTPGM
jgi:hypothetical protein